MLALIAPVGATLTLCAHTTATKPIPVIFWENQFGLKNMLREKVKKLEEQDSVMQ
jgi:hypothetical protein